MEFPFLLPRVLRSAAVVALDANTMRHHMTPELQQVVDAMGLASMKAQGLSCVLTTCSKIMTTHQRLYIASEEKKVLGILKVGTKQLFVWRETGRICEITPLCVLDFFVHESRQRCGIGKLLFESMLERENLAPQMLGFDQPSHKFLSFLRRHYGLFDYVAQKNNFVVFNAYFEGATVRCRAENPQASPFDRPLTARQRPHRGERVRFEPESEPRVRSPPQEPPKRTPEMLNRINTLPLHQSSSHRTPPQVPELPVGSTSSNPSRQMAPRATSSQSTRIRYEVSLGGFPSDRAGQNAPPPRRSGVKRIVSAAPSGRPFA